VAKTDGNQIKIGYIQDSQVANVINSMVSTSTVLKEATSSPVSDVSKDGPVIGSKSGKKYYFPWCGTVKRIKPENQVKFNSISDAKKAGFVAGGNCKGLN